MTRREYADELTYNLSDEECQHLFNRTHEQLSNFNELVWNFELETAYNEYISGSEYDDEETEKSTLHCECAKSCQEWGFSCSTCSCDWK